MTDTRSLTWKSHPAKERPLAAVFVTIIIVTAMLVVYVSMKDRLMTVLAGLILFVGLSTFFFATTYTVDSNRVKIKYLFSTKDRNLSAFRACYPEKHGILLSPYLSPSRLENFRGFYLRYGKNNKGEVDEFIKKLLEMPRQDIDAEASEAKPDAV
jgi:hypothetical protein